MSKDAFVGADEFSDPIIIPITITIPNPVRQQPSGPFDRGPTFHPSFTDPDWFHRQHRPGPTLAQLVGPLPFPAPLVLPSSPDEVAAALKEFRAAVARARRRAQFAEQEIARGEYGSAAGHLLGGAPYPPEVEDGTVLNNETIRSPDLDALTDEVEKDLEKRLNDPLNERHREDARNDLLGKPVIDNRGRTRRHDEEVATNANGLEDRAKALEDKTDHNVEWVRPRPNASIDRARALSAKIRSILSDLNKEVPGLDKLRDEVRNTGTIRRSGSSPGS